MTGLLREEERPSSSAAIEALRFLPAEGVGLAALHELLLLWIVECRGAQRGMRVAARMPESEGRR